MFTQITKQASMTPPASGGVSSARIPATGTHHAIYLAPKDSSGVATPVSDIIANIGNIVVKLNGEQLMEGSAAFFLQRQKYNGDSIGAGNLAGILPIFLTPDHLATWQEKNVYAIGMAGVTSFTVDVNITGVTNMATIDVLSEFTPEVRNVGQHIRIKKLSQSFASAGQQEISTLPLEGPTVAYKTLFVEATTVTEHTVKIANYAILDQVKLPLNNTLLKRARRTAQTGFHPIAFDLNNDLLSLLPMAGVQDFRVLLTFSAAPNAYFIYAEQVHGLEATPSVK